MASGFALKGGRVGLGSLPPLGAEASGDVACTVSTSSDFLDSLGTEALIQQSNTLMYGKD